MSALLLMQTGCRAAEGSAESIPLSSGSDSDCVGERFEQLFDQMLNTPFQAGSVRISPASHTASGSRLSRAFTCSKATVALASFVENRGIDMANRHVLEICEYYQNHPDDTSYLHDSNAWVGSVFVRLIQLYGSRGLCAPGRLHEEVEQKLLALMWDWANGYSEIARTQYDQSVEWRIHESENHDAQRSMPMWGFALIFKDHPDYKNLLYADGYTAEEHFSAWTAYFKTYLTERAKRGLFIEIATNFYSLHTLKGIYDMCDFSPDPVLKKRARMLLDLFWATWAQEQLDGIRGGGKARLYQGPSAQFAAHDYMRTLGWYYFGIGKAEEVPWDLINVGYAGFICAATSIYRPHPVVTGIAVNPCKKKYEIIQRRMGLAKDGFNRNPDYHLRTDFGGILRYSYRTPEFILGTLMLEPRPADDWTLISSQNRWSGVIFKGDPYARIYPQCRSTVGNRTYNQHWSVQSEGALIVQKLKTSSEASEMRVWIASVLGHRDEKNGWVFCEADGAYAAVYVVSGGFQWGESGNWMTLNNEYSPVIIEAALKKDFGSYSLFQNAMLARHLRVENGLLVYKSLSGDVLQFDTQQKLMPLVNGIAVNLKPKQTFNSPFIQSDWASGVVTLRNGEEQTVLDFNTVEVR